MLRLHTLLLALPLAVACGSSDGGSDLFGSSGGTAATASSTPDASGGAGAATGGSGNLGSTGGSSGTPTGGASPSGGATANGGASPSGGTTAAGGTSSGGSGTAGTAAGGAVTTLPDGGIVLGDGGVVVPGQLPTGIIVTQACADCTATYCPDETAACTADPDCVTGIQCLNTCIFPPACAACFLVNGVTSAPQSAKDLSSCATQYCDMCPQFG